MSPCHYSTEGGSGWRCPGPAHRIIEVPLSSRFNDRAPTIGNPEIGERLPRRSGYYRQALLLNEPINLETNIREVIWSAARRGAHNSQTRQKQRSGP